MKKDSPESAADEILPTLAGRHAFLCFVSDTGETAPRKDAKPAKKSKTKPVTKSEDLSTSAFLISLLQQGFSRLFRDGEIIELQKPEDYPFDDFNEHVRADRPAERLTPTYVSGLSIRSRTVFARVMRPIVETTDGARLKFSDRYICKYDGTRIRGAGAARCLASTRPSARARRVRVLATRSASITAWSFRIRWSRSRTVRSSRSRVRSTRGRRRSLLQYRQAANIDDDECPSPTLPEYQQKCIIYGDEGWRGIKGFFKWLETKKYKLHVRVFLAKYRGYTTCPDCERPTAPAGGARRKDRRRDRCPRSSRCRSADAHEFFEELNSARSEQRSPKSCCSRSAGG